jgi:hemolysin activation/secretion protein
VQDFITSPFLIEEQRYREGLRNSTQPMGGTTELQSSCRHTRYIYRNIARAVQQARSHDCSSEQFAAGGAFSVRDYKESELLDDDGMHATV